MQVNYRDHDFAEHATARRVIATAFAGEPFAYGMFGASAIDRLVGMMGEYSTWPFSSESIIVAASCDDTLIGVALATLPGECHLCNDFNQGVLDDNATNASRIEHEFQAACRHAHATQNLPTHAHIASVAVDPFLQGAGVGSGLVDALLDRIWATGAPCVVLECLTTREAFYQRHGFRRVVEFADPGGPGLRSVLMQSDAPQSPRGQTSLDLAAP